VSFETITNTYSVEDVGSLTDCIKLLSSLSVASEWQRDSRGVMRVMVVDPDCAAVRKMESDFAGAAAIVVEGTTDAKFLAATIACVRGTLAGPIILNTSTVRWVQPLVTLGDVAAASRLGDQAANTITRQEPAAISVVEWKGSARKLAETMGLVHAVHQYASLARASFSVIGPVNVQASNDPETDGRYLAIDFRVGGSVDEALASEERFQTAAVREMPMDKLFHLRLTYDLI
jgi:hypothetical protein